MPRLSRFLKNSFFSALTVVLFSMCAKKMDFVTGPSIIDDPEYHSFVPVLDKVGEPFGGYYVALPPSYFDHTDSFPLIVFLHGLGQMGNGTTDLDYILQDGIGKLIKDKKFPVSVTSNGEKFKFIVVSPQSSRQPTIDEVMSFISRIHSRYHINGKRIYLAGLSLGAVVVTQVAAASPQTFAAVVPIAGVSTGSGMEERCRQIADGNLPLWEFHNADDPLASVADARRFIRFMEEFNPRTPPLFTVFDVYGHDAWTRALDPTYKENGKNIYEWMLQYTR